MEILLNDNWNEFDVDNFKKETKRKRTNYFYNDKRIGVYTKIKYICEECNKKYECYIFEYPKFLCKICTGKKNCLEKYGVEFSSQRQDIKNKISNTVKSQKCQDKTKKTCMRKYGVESTNSIEIVKSKKKLKLKSKYGVEFPSQINGATEKKKETFLKHYNVDWYTKTNEYKENYKNNSLKKYGVNSPNKAESVKEKKKNALIKKYGTQYVFSIPEIEYKRKKTNIEKYGVDVPFKNKDIQQKARNTLFKKYGVSNAYLINVNEKRSKIGIYLFNKLKEVYPDIVPEYDVPNLYAVGDYYVPSLNKIIELYGDFWHCNPRKYDENYIHPIKQISAQKIWRHDLLREKRIRKNGYDFEIIWECDIKDYIKNQLNGA